MICNLRKNFSEFKGKTELVLTYGGQTLWTPLLLKNQQEGDICGSKKYVPVGLTVTAAFKKLFLTPSPSRFSRGPNRNFFMCGLGLAG